MKKVISPVTKADLDETLQHAFEKYDEKNRTYRDEILTSLDHIMKEFETIREDNTLGAYQTRELREQVDEHEKRISKIETAAQ